MAIFSEHFSLVALFARFVYLLPFFYLFLLFLVIIIYLFIYLFFFFLGGGALLSSPLSIIVHP